MKTKAILLAIVLSSIAQLYGQTITIITNQIVGGKFNPNKETVSSLWNYDDSFTSDACPLTTTIKDEKVITFSFSNQKPICYFVTHIVQHEIHPITQAETIVYRVQGKGQNIGIIGIFYDKRNHLNSTVVTVFETNKTICYNKEQYKL